MIERPTTLGLNEYADFASLLQRKSWMLVPWHSLDVDLSEGSSPQFCSSDTKVLGEKLATKPLNEYLPRYKGAPDLRSLLAYISKGILSLNPSKFRNICTQFSSENHRRNTQFLLWAMNGIMLNKGFEDVGLF